MKCTPDSTLVIAMIVCFAACGGKTEPEETAAPEGYNKKDSVTQVNVGQASTNFFVVADADGNVFTMLPYMASSEGAVKVQANKNYIYYTHLQICKEKHYAHQC